MRYVKINRASWCLEYTDFYISEPDVFTGPEDFENLHTSSSIKSNHTWACLNSLGPVTEFITKAQLKGKQLFDEEHKEIHCVYSNNQTTQPQSLQKESIDVA